MDGISILCDCFSLDEITTPRRKTQWKVEPDARDALRSHFKLLLNLWVGFFFFVFVFIKASFSDHNGHNSLLFLVGGLLYATSK